MQSPSLKRTARRREITLAAKRCTPTATVVRSPPSTSASPPPPDPEPPSRVRRQCPCRGFQQPGPGQKRLLRGGPTRTSLCAPQQPGLCSHWQEPLCHPPYTEKACWRRWCRGEDCEAGVTGRDRHSGCNPAVGPVAATLQR